MNSNRSGPKMQGSTTAYHKKKLILNKKIISQPSI